MLHHNNLRVYSQHHVQIAVKKYFDAPMKSRYHMVKVQIIITVVTRSHVGMIHLVSYLRMHQIRSVSNPALWNTIYASWAEEMRGLL